MTLHRLPSAALALSLILLTGCASAGYKKANAAADSLRDAALALQDESRQLEITVASLKDLVHEPADLKRQFNKYSRELDRLDSRARRADERIADLQQKSVDYFKVWEQDLEELNYEVIRARSQARKERVTAQINTIVRRFQETQEVVHPMIVYLNDLRTALSADLTPGGLEAVKDIAARAEENARIVQMGLAQLASDLNSSGDDLSSFAPADESRSRTPSGTLQEQRAAALAP